MCKRRSVRRIYLAADGVFRNCDHNLGRSDNFYRSKNPTICKSLYNV